MAIQEALVVKIIVEVVWVGSATVVTITRKAS